MSESTCSERDTIVDMVKLSTEIREMSAATNEDLHRQGQQIQRSLHQTQTVHAGLSRAERLIGRIKSVFVDLFSPTEKKVELSTPAYIPAHPSTSPSFDTNIIVGMEVENFYNQLSQHLGEIKESALDMNAELNKQNQQLDQLEHQVDTGNSRLRRINREVRELKENV